MSRIDISTIATLIMIVVAFMGFAVGLAFFIGLPIEVVRFLFTGVIIVMFPAAVVGAIVCPSKEELSAELSQK